VHHGLCLLAFVWYKDFTSHNYLQIVIFLCFHCCLCSHILPFNCSPQFFIAMKVHNFHMPIFYFPTLHHNLNPFYSCPKLYNMLQISIDGFINTIVTFHPIYLLLYIVFWLFSVVVHIVLVLDEQLTSIHFELLTKVCTNLTKKNYQFFYFFLHVSESTLQWTFMEVKVVIFLGLSKYCHIQLKCIWKM
jgi:hypothetical protein